MEDKITMSSKEINRIPIIEKVLNKRLSQVEAQKLLDLSYRQTNRIIQKVRKDGISSITHGNRGKPSKKKISNEKEQEIIDIYCTKYDDFKPTFANEKLEEFHDIHISSESLRKILISNDLWTPRKNKNKDLHVWRERNPHPGEMIQIDGSHHRWLEDRLDQEFCLMGYIDDSNNVVFAKFYEYEGIFPFMDSFIDFAKIYGFPHSIYMDRHSTYKTTRQATIDEELRDDQAETQVQRVMREIGVKLIHARSPQAKGRVERMFSTHQDRLVKEMRLANISTIEDANKFLPVYLEKHNNKFSVTPKEKASFFKSVPSDFDYKWSFTINDKRIVQKDYTIQWRNRRFLIQNPSLPLKKQKILIKQALDGSLRFETSKKILSVKEITEKDYIQAKKSQKQIIKILKSKSKNYYKKDKKSWMADFYIGKPEVALTK